MGYGYGKQTYHSQASATDNAGNRVKCVFDNSMVAHIWAQGMQSFGRSGNGNFYFQGTTLYSYGSHFVVAQLLPDGNALINADSASVTTSAHCHDARLAVRGTYTLVPDLTAYMQNGERFPSPDDAQRHIAKHWNRTGLGTAIHLLELSGMTPGKARRVAAQTLARAEKQAAKDKAAEVARDLRQLLKEAARTATATDPDWLVYQDRLLRSTYYRRAESGHWRKAKPAELSGQGPVASQTLLKQQKAAKDKGWTARARTISKRRAQLRAALAAMLARENRKNNNSHVASALTEVRRGLRTLETSGTLSESRRYTHFGDSLSILKDSRFVSGALRGKLGALLDNARIVADTLLTQERAAQLERDKERAAARFLKETKDRADWLDGGNVRFYGADLQGGALLRVTGLTREPCTECTGESCKACGGYGRAITGGTLETSQGASVPLLHAIKVFRFVRHVLASGKPWARNGQTIRVGHFTVDSISLDGTMRAGCHTLNLMEMERIAASIGLATIAPDVAALESTS